MKPFAFLVLMVSVFLFTSAHFFSTAEEKQGFHTLKKMSFHFERLDPTTELVLFGNSKTDRAAVFVKIEPATGASYQMRFDAERWVKKGAFSLYYPLFGVKKNNGKKFKFTNQIQITVFTFEEYADTLQLDLAVRTYSPSTSSEIALDFGPENAATFPGFVGVSPNDSRISCERRCVALERPYHDQLIGDGVEGITGITLSALPGKYKLAMWLEDTGEWEYVPHFLERRIKVNGRILEYQNRTPAKWYQQIYENSLKKEWGKHDSHWASFGSKRGGLYIFEIESKSHEIRIELAGDRRAATYVGALLLTPGKGSSGLEQVLQKQAKRSNTRWPIYENTLSTARHLRSLKSVTNLPSDGVVFRRIRIANAQILEVHTPIRGENRLDLKRWVAETKTVRPFPNAEFLVKDNRHLIPVSTTNREGEAELVLRIGSSATKPAGAYNGKIIWSEDGHKAATPYQVDVISFERPDKTHPIAAYQELSPPELWFSKKVAATGKCVSDILSNFGVSRTALPFNPHLLKNKDALVKSFIDTPSEEVFAYAHLKSFLNHYGWSQTIELIKEIEARKSKSKKRIIWSLADEPSKSDVSRLQAEADKLRRAVPDIDLAGHLNRSSLSSMVDMFDVVIVNEGFGSQQKIFRLTGNQNREIWLYNFKNPRLGGGIYARLLQAKGYLQWHSFMPTAHPHDPTDGREGDVYLVYPERDPCKNDPVIDLDLILLRQAADDAKWMAWLELNRPRELGKLREKLLRLFSNAGKREQEILQSFRNITQEIMASSKQLIPGIYD